MPVEPKPVSRITYDGRCYERREGESLLDALLRAQVPAPHSCRQATCQKCMMKAVSGDIPARAREPLSPMQRHLGFFLACVCYPKGPVTAASAKAHRRFTDAVIESKQELSARICRLRLRPAEPLHYRPGQFIDLRRDDSELPRSYSLASLPEEDSWLEIHVQSGPGEFSRWLREDVQPGDSVQIQGPNGQCVYLPGAPEAPLLMIGTGSGLAPLLGIVRDALHRGHRGPIYLYHGSRDKDGLYGEELLHDLIERHPQLHYIRCMSGSALPGCEAGRADVLALSHHSRLDGWRAYLCGHPEMVRNAQREVLQRGVRWGDLRTDAFG